MKKLLVVFAVAGAAVALAAALRDKWQPLVDAALAKVEDALEGGSDGPDDSDPEHPGARDGDANGFLPGEDVRP